MISEPMSLVELNDQFGIDGQLQFVEGPEGKPMIAIANGLAQATISPYAGQVLSFQPTSEPTDLMFLSAKAYYQTGKAIKGGVPICWPWFGPDPEGLGRPSHGFVRNRTWNVVSTGTTVDGATQVTLGLQSTEETLGIWPYPFELAIAITIGQSLQINLITRNTGTQTLTLTQALHTYFQVGDISQVQVLGLEDSSYLDKVDGGAEKIQAGPILVSEEVDRVYTNAPSELVITDAALQRRIRIASTGSKTAVVWNPWVKIAASMADLDDADYQRFICVETANAAADIIAIAPNEAFTLGATYSIERP